MRDKMSVKECIEYLCDITGSTPNWCTQSTASGGTSNNSEEKIPQEIDEYMEEEKQDRSATDVEFQKEFYFYESDDDLVIQKLIDEVIVYLKNEWQLNWVVYPIVNINMWSSIFNLNYCFIVEIDAPLLQRFHRFNKKYTENLTLEDFVKLDDKVRFETNFCD